MRPWRNSSTPELIFRRGTPPDAEYTFEHAPVQDAAYTTLLRSRRQQLHGRIRRTAINWETRREGEWNGCVSFSIKKLGPVQRRDRLGGLLRYDHRDAV
jgi:hypothetical protein